MMCLSDCSTSTGALSDRSTFTLTGALSDRSTFTSTDVRVTDLHHCFFGGLVVVCGRGCLQELKLSPPLSFHSWLCSSKQFFVTQMGGYWTADKKGYCSKSLLN